MWVQVFNQRMESDWGEALDELRWHWGEAYVIECFGPGRWVAQRRDNKGTLRAGSSDLLDQVIRADYDREPVPR